MAKGRFLNQKLGKRMSRRSQILKAQITGRRGGQESVPADQRFPKKGASREEKL